MANVLEKKTFRVDRSRGCRHVTYLFCYILSHLNFEPYPLSCNTAGRQGGTLFSPTW